MRVFLAGTSTLSSSGDFLEKMALSNNLYVLESFYYMTPFIERLIPYFKDFLLDSGAFTFMNNSHKTKSDYNSYLNALINFSKEKRMFINRISSHYIDNCRRTIERVTTYGKCRNTNVAIDCYNYKGTTIEKRIVAWGDNWQKIVNKVRNKQGKFERIG